MKFADRQGFDSKFELDNKQLKAAALNEQIISKQPLDKHQQIPPDTVKTYYFE